MERTNEDIKMWAEIVQDAEIADELDSVNNPNKEESDGKHELTEMPMIQDIYSGDRADADETLQYQTDGLDSSRLVPVQDHGDFSTFRNPRGDAYLAYNKNGKCIGLLRGSKSGSIFQIDNTISDSQSGTKGVMRALFADCVGDGNKIISDITQSPAAKSFWQKLVQSGSTVYYVVYGEVKGRVTPQNMEQLWTDDSDNEAAEIRLLLVK